ncbi:MAG TPA: alpha/beta fold hydrolase [Streptosporangiaceae bacterium]|nr:alpha/beta fold hydrolase [Streptosporangiaceae bacterium]
MGFSGRCWPLRLGTAGLSVMLVTTGCSNGGLSDTKKAAESSTADALASYYRQKVNWHPCPEPVQTMQCATVSVPVSYADPAGRSIKLAVDKIPATDPAGRLGSLLVDPGGPGGSGVQYVAGSQDTFKTLATHYDVIGFDPRGIGFSDPVKCLDDKQMDAYLDTDFDPAATRQAVRTLQAVKRYADSCQENTGPLLAQVGTANVARDMDVIRGALGDRKLDYLGISYGTYIGQEYARLFPSHVGRMVLDSVDNPEQDAADDQPDAAESQFDKAVSTILTDCTRKPSCPVGTAPDQTGAKLNALLARLAEHPAPAEDGRALTSSLARMALLQATYSPTLWGPLDEGLTQAERGHGEALLQIADQSNGRAPDGGYSTEKTGLYSVNCLEAGNARKTVDQAATELMANRKELNAYSPIFGVMLAVQGDVCSFWPVAGQPRTAISSSEVPPILMLNNTGDAATPLTDAEQVVKRFAGARLVINESEGHGVYPTEANTCARTITDNYLFSGTLPAQATTTCKPAAQTADGDPLTEPAALDTAGGD